jgi:DNA processing protein
MTVLESLLILNSLPLLGPVRIQLLLKHFGSPQNILHAGSAELIRVLGIDKKISETIVNWQEAVSVEEEQKMANHANVRIMTFLDDDYPENLKQIYDPPIILYVKGTLVPEDKHAIALVGTRRSTLYGRETAARLARQMASAGITIVSGLARGIDAAAHEGALLAHGRTIGVLGSGFNHPYPVENLDLMDRIAGSGAVISEYPMNATPDKMNFPIRNRVISGLSLGVLVGEAPRHSGAMITVTHALHQNRFVFAVPGRVDSPTFTGNHQLIKEGAKLVENADDILSEFEYLFPPSALKVEKGGPMQGPTPLLDEKEEKIFNLLSAEEKNIEEIIMESGLPARDVSVVLLRLEVKRLIRQLPGKTFVRARLMT